MKPLGSISQISLGFRPKFSIPGIFHHFAFAFRGRGSPSPTFKSRESRAKLSKMSEASGIDKKAATNGKIYRNVPADDFSDVQHVVIAENPLGLLKDLPGTWEGTGLNFIALPTKAGSFFTITNRTRETFVFTDIGGPVTNRGSTGQDNVENFGVSYLQTVFDVKPNPAGGAPVETAIHVEPGFFLTCPPNNEQSSETIVRLSSIPHGDTLMAQSIEAQIFTNQKPTFATESGSAGLLKPIIVDRKYYFLISVLMRD